jgi:hypothetical protein
VNTLKQVGGSDLYSVTTGILKKVLPNDMVEKFSWAGVKKKLPFKDLALTKVILGKFYCYTQVNNTLIEHFLTLYARYF